MTGRRRHTRFEIVNAQGVLRVLQDVLVQRTRSDEFIVIGCEPERPGEIVTVYQVGNGGDEIRARVIDSRPVLVDGAVRHRLRLAPLDGDETPTIDPPEKNVREAE